jgi:DNA polymerase III delta prime subunit
MKINQTSLLDFPFALEKTPDLLRQVLRGEIELPDDKFGLMFYGPEGTGKTALSLAMPKFMEASPNISDLGYGSAIAFTGLHVQDCHPALAYSDLFKRIRYSMDYSQYKGRRYIVLEEVDTLPAQAIDGLKSLMGPAGPPGVVYILTTNNRSKLPMPLRSRFLDLPMQPPPVEEMVRVAQRLIVSNGEPVTAIPHSDLTAFAVAARGDLRNFFPPFKAAFRAYMALKLTASAPNLIQLPVASSPRVQP